MKKTEKIELINIIAGKELSNENIEKLLSVIDAMANETPVNAKPVTKAEPKVEKKYSSPVHSVKIGNEVKGIAFNNGFTPKPVFNAIKYSLKEAGAKWDKDNNAWVFPSHKECKAWADEQAKRYK